MDGIEKELSAKAMCTFPMHFCIIQYNLNIMKITHIWKNKANILETRKKDEELSEVIWSLVQGFD
jgi:hypothetical protein